MLGASLFAPTLMRSARVSSCRPLLLPFTRVPSPSTLARSIASSANQRPLSVRTKVPSPRISSLFLPSVWQSRSFHLTRAARNPEASTTSIPASPQSPTSTSAATPSAPTTDVQEPTSKAVGYHSIFLALLVYAIILVGGLTRLTESGLSITEWNPGFKGMWLPSSDEEWEGEWAKYRETPEFVLLNSKMTLPDFKTIYMWEWSHRIIGRLIGVAYVLPALYFVARGQVKPPFRSKLFLIGLGIGAQGAMGWYMVKSGLVSPEGTLHVDPDSEPHSGALAPPSTPASWTPRVSHFRLAAHLGLAFLVYAGMLRTGLSVFREYNLAKNVGKASGLATGPGVRERLIATLSQPKVAKYRGAVAAVTGLVFLTAMSGAFVAGLDAGLVYNEFPTMGDGRIAPPLDEMFDERYARSGSGSGSGDSSSSSMVLHNLTQNPVTVQFIHRCLAVTTFAVVAGLAWRTHSLNRALKVAGAKPLPPAVPRLANAAFAAVTLQASLGISTLIYMVPIELASAHQAGSVLLLSVMLALWGTLRVPSSMGGVSMAKQVANVAAAARGGSATAASAAGGAGGLVRGIHTASQRRALRLQDLPDKVKLKTGPSGR